MNVPRWCSDFTVDLQQVAYDSAEATPAPRVRTAVYRHHPPRERDRPAPRFAAGTTPLPSQMAVGATWNPAYARTVGQIAGTELDAMGINLLLGPALDVAQQPPAGRTLDLGVRHLRRRSGLGRPDGAGVHHRSARRQPGPDRGHRAEFPRSRAGRYAARTCKSRSCRAAWTNCASLIWYLLSPSPAERTARWPAPTGCNVPICAICDQVTRTSRARCAWTRSRPGSFSPWMNSRPGARTAW